MLDGAEATIQDVDINLKISTLIKGHKNTKLSSSIEQNVWKPHNMTDRSVGQTILN